MCNLDLYLSTHIKKMLFVWKLCNRIHPRIENLYVDIYTVIPREVISVNYETENFYLRIIQLNIYAFILMKNIMFVFF